MKKITGLLMASVLVGAVLSSCGDKYVPLTEEQKTAKADSIFAATSEAYKAEKESACEAELQAKVDAKVQELTTAATASN